MVYGLDIFVVYSLWFSNRTHTCLFSSECVNSKAFEFTFELFEFAFSENNLLCPPVADFFPSGKIGVTISAL